jgi:ATP-binding cassette, subfamily C, bacterial LapB
MAENSTTSWLKPFLKPLRATFNEVVAMSAFVNLLALAVPIFTMQVYNRVVAHNGISTLKGLVVGMVIIVVFDYVLRQARSRIMQTIALRIDVQVGRKLFNKFMSLPLQTLESQPSAHWLALFRDADAVRNTLSGASAILIADLPFAILFLVIIFVIATPIAWVLVIVMPVFMFVAWRSSSVMSVANQNERATAQTRDSLVAEMINARTTIKALSLDKVMRPMWEDMQSDNIETSVIRGSKTDSFSNMGASLTMVTSISLTTVGALFIINQELTIGALIATNMLSGRLLGPLNQLVGQWRTYSSFRQSVDRLGELFNTISERQESEVEMDKPRGEITMENITFAYSEELPKVINDIEITFKATGVHALVGRNGSGKSTMLKLIQGLYKPMNGRVLVDGADISQFSRAEMSLWMGYVPQDCILFTGNVRDNIAQRIPDATDEQILKAAQAAGVHTFIIDMPEGYSTEIGEAGQRLSGGQRQRIAIARALVGDPPVVLLDEPSSSLDRQAEFELRNTLTSIAKERTVIIVTHSPILLATCDDLVALDKGRIALAGPSKDILPKLFGTGSKSGQKKAPPPGQAAKQPPAQQQARPQQAPSPQASPQQAQAQQKPAAGQPNIAQPIKARPTPAKPIAAKPIVAKPLEEPKPADAAPAPAPAPAKPAGEARPVKPDDTVPEIDIPTPPEKTEEDKP